MSISRRDFIKDQAALAVGVTLAPLALQDMIAAPARTAKVVQAVLPSAKTGAEADHVLHALDRGMEALLQIPGKDAWAEIVSPRDIVGLKVSCLAGKYFSTHRSLVQAIMTRLISIGLRPGQIIIWDRLNMDLQGAGFPLNQNPKQALCYGNDAAGYSQALYEYQSACSRLSRIVTEHCTAIINLPVLKDHGIVGISAGLKNFFGAIDNPNKYHDSCGDPYVADVNMIPALRNKVRLTICDAITAQYEGGPPFMRQWNWPMRSLLLAKDMVALDQVCWTIIENKRSENDLPTLRDAGRLPSYIHTAAMRGLGVDDLQKIEVIEV